MPLYLRKIDSKRVWDNDEPLPWLAEDDIQADPVTDLKTSNNILSVFYVTDKTTGLDRIVAALAATRNSINHLDYILFDERLLLELGIKIARKTGETPDEQVNDWHRDLIELSGFKLVKLVKLIFTKGTIGRIQERRVKQLIKNSTDSGWLSRKDKIKLKDPII